MAAATAMANPNVRILDSLIALFLATTEVKVKSNGSRERQ
jgi:hypothetical protein